jgi:hygromycin-B 7''-O-kinase
VAPLSGGDNATTFELRLADGPSLVLKLYSELLRSEAPKEAFVYELVAGQGGALPMATILHTDDSRTVLPGPFTVMTKLEGELLMKLQPRLGDAELVSIYRQIGTLLRRLHEIPLGVFGYVDADRIVDPQPTNADYMRSQFEKRLRSFVELGGDQGLQRRIAGHVAEHEELFAGCEHSTLCHNDCHEANVLVARDDDGRWRITGIVDFGNATAADPLLDLAKTSSNSRWASDMRVEALAEGHGDLRQDWREALRLYELYHRLELWWWFASTGSHVEALPLLEAAMANTTA